MSNFKDKNGKAWSLAITVSTVKRVKELAKFDILAMAENESQSLVMLYQDPMTLVDVMYAVCKPQADLANITDEQFGELFDGDSLESATEALVQGILDFFPPRRRLLLEKAVVKLKEVETLAMERMTTEMDGIDVNALMEKAIKEMKSGK